MYWPRYSLAASHIPVNIVSAEGIDTKFIDQRNDGKIARHDGEVDWLDKVPHPAQSDYGYASFYDSIDVTIQGYNTYSKIMEWGVAFPYKEKKNYVLSRKTNLTDTEYVQFISQDPVTFIQQLKQEEGKGIWLIGGGQVNTMLWNAGLIDAIILHIMPIIIPEGIDLFEHIPNEALLTLISTQTYSSGVVELLYSI